MKCIKCGFEEHENNSAYCENCGHPINSNYCTYSRCVRNSNSDEPIPCNETACYCSDCGTETEYYKQGLIKPNSYS